jgi:hypothetical protein
VADSASVYQGLIDALVGVAVVVIPVVGAMLAQALRKLSTKWHLEGEALDSAKLETEIRTVLNAGIAKVLPMIDAKGWNHPDVRAAVLAYAGQYMAQRYPDRAAAIIAESKQGTEPTMQTDTAIIHDTLAGRFPAAMAQASEGPATPPIPPAVLIPVQGEVRVRDS